MELRRCPADLPIIAARPSFPGRLLALLGATLATLKKRLTRMDRRTIFTKTAKGMLEATGKTSALSRDLRNILKEVDGRPTLRQLSHQLGKITEPKLLQ